MLWNILMPIIVGNVDNGKHWLSNKIAFNISEVADKCYGQNDHYMEVETGLRIVSKKLGQKASKTAKIGWATFLKKGTLWQLKHY